MHLSTAHRYQTLLAFLTIDLITATVPAATAATVPFSPAGGVDAARLVPSTGGPDVARSAGDGHCATLPPTAPPSPVTIAGTPFPRADWGCAPRT